MAFPQFSHRTVWEFQENPLTHLLRQLRREGKEIVDWTVSNPTLCGFAYARERISAGLTQDSSFVYAPDSAGHPSARDSIAGFLASRGVEVSADRILLTASSSEGYSHLFRLLCNPGESIAIPKPGYPLFDDLARINDVALQTYRFHYAGAWHLDEERMRRAIQASTRAIVVVHPNNPTGSFLSTGEQEMVAQIAREYGLAVISDEVFLTFPFDPRSTIRSCAHINAPLVFTVNGLSKLAGLPQMKLGWLTVHGDEPLVRQAMQRLEYIADTYLSVNTPIQMALPGILATADGVGEQIRSRVAENYLLLCAALGGSAISVLHAEAGWNAVLRLPHTRGDEEWAVHLLQHSGVLVYPGHFFDLDIGACVVVSLLPEEPVFRSCCARLRQGVEDDIDNHPLLSHS
jgi:alanine-synthesizing transaminase